MPGVDPPPSENLDPHVRQARREMAWILGAWLFFCLWVVGISSQLGYPEPGEELSLTFGMPSWVFWGVALPWAVAAAFSIFFALRIMQDQPLEPVEGEELTRD